MNMEWLICIKCLGRFCGLCMVGFVWLSALHYAEVFCGTVGSGEAAVEHHLGRRHDDGPVHRRKHPRDARVDYPELACSGACPQLPVLHERGMQGRVPGCRLSPQSQKLCSADSGSSRHELALHCDWSQAVLLASISECPQAGACSGAPLLRIGG